MLPICGREDLWHRTPSSILLLSMKWKIEQASTALRNNQYFPAAEEHVLGCGGTQSQAGWRMSGSSLAARLEAAAGCSRQRRLANRAASPGARPKLCFPPLCALVTTSWGSSTGGDVSKHSHSFASWHQQRMQERKGVEGLGEGGNHQLQMEQEQQNRLTTRNHLNETVHGELGARSNSS